MQVEPAGLQPGDVQQIGEHAGDASVEADLVQQLELAVIGDADPRQMSRPVNPLMDVRGLCSSWLTVAISSMGSVGSEADVDSSPVVGGADPVVRQCAVDCASPQALGPEEALPR